MVFVGLGAWGADAGEWIAITVLMFRSQTESHLLFAVLP